MAASVSAVLTAAWDELSTMLLAERALGEWVTAGAVLGLNYGVSSRVPYTLRQTPAFSGELSYTSREPNTISGPLLFGLVFGLPAALVLFTSALSRPPDAAGRLGKAAVRRGTREVHMLMLAVLEAYALAGCWKIWLNKAVGRERPDFLSRLASGDAALIADGRASYPSGHAAYSHCAGAVCFWWLAHRLAVFRSRRAESDVLPSFARLLVAVAPVGVATYVSTTRLTDYVHHFSDVNAGVFIGICSGTATYFLNHRQTTEDAAPPPKPETAAQEESLVSAEHAAL